MLHYMLQDVYTGHSPPLKWKLMDDPVLKEKLLNIIKEKVALKKGTNLDGVFF